MRICNYTSQREAEQRILARRRRSVRLTVNRDQSQGEQIFNRRSVPCPHITDNRHPSNYHGTPSVCLVTLGFILILTIKSIYSLLICLSSSPIREIREKCLSLLIPSLSLSLSLAEVYLLNVSSLFYFSNFSRVSSRKWSQKTERERDL